jgi:hypothetical protein
VARLIAGISSSTIVPIVFSKARKNVEILCHPALLRKNAPVQLILNLISIGFQLVFSWFSVGAQLVFNWFSSQGGVSH